LLNCRPQVCNLLFNSCIHLLDLQFLPTALIPHPSLLQIQIQSNPSLRARDLFTQPLLELPHIRNQPVIISLQRSEVILLDELKLGFKLRKVDLLSVLMLDIRGMRPE
jgi:hypothetical protein